MSKFFANGSGLLCNQEGCSIGLQDCREARDKKREEYRAVLDKAGDKLTTAQKKDLDKIGNEIDEMSRHLDAHQRLMNIEAEDLMAGRTVPGQAGQTGPVAAQLGDSPFGVIQANGRRMPLLRNTQRLADFHPQGRSADDEWSLSNFIRANMGLERPANAVVTGPATVPTYVGSQIIDAVRAQSRIVQAGASTISIDGPTNLAKIVTDPVVYQHAEGVADINESDLVLSPITLNPAFLVAAVPLSAEIVEDSQNLDDALRISLGAAFAGKPDALCLAKILADTGIPDSTVAHDPATWAGVLAAIGAALGANQELPIAHVGSEADFIARASQLASTGGQWLGKPPALEAMQEFFTTKCAAGTAISGDFFRGIAIAARQELRLEVVRWAKHTSATHLLIAHARLDGVILQSK